MPLAASLHPFVLAGEGVEASARDRDSEPFPRPSLEVADSGASSLGRDQDGPGPAFAVVLPALARRAGFDPSALIAKPAAAGV